MNFYEEATKAAEQNKSSIKEELKHINDYIANTYEYIFRDENDEIASIIKHEKRCVTNSTYTKNLLMHKITTIIQNTNKYFCIVLQKYGKVIAVVSNCTMYISEKCTAKDIFILKEKIEEQIGE